MATLASVLDGTDSQPWHVNAGTLSVETGDVNDAGHLFLVMDPAAVGFDGLEFHSWVSRGPVDRSG